MPKEESSGQGGGSAGIKQAFIGVITNACRVHGDTTTDFDFKKMSLTRGP